MPTFAKTCQEQLQPREDSQLVIALIIDILIIIEATRLKKQRRQYYIVIIDNNRYQMRNLWGYISKPYSNNLNSSEDNENLAYTEQKKLTQDYYQLRSLQQQLQKLQSIQVFAFPNAKVASTFEDVMGTLHGLINVIQSLKEDTQKNHEKIGEYDRLKSMVSQHSQIVKHIEEQSALNLNRIYEQKREAQSKYQAQLQGLKQKIAFQETQIGELNQKITQKSQQNQKLKQELEIKKSQIQQLTQYFNRARTKINQLTTVQDSSIKFQAKGYKVGEKLELETVLVYSKLRRWIYSFLQPKDFYNLHLSNKQIQFICNRTVKKQFFGILMRNKQRQIEALGRNVKEYERIYDNFPAQNIRTNAIKYLFFKVKPGAYMLPYFQNQEEYAEKVEQKPKVSNFSSFFKKKAQNQHPKQKALSFQLLKNDNEFKQTYKKVQTFFDKLFGIEDIEDLKTFNDTMKRQLSELKTELKSHEKAIQLLCMSRFLYLQINELNNLLQVCFALLITKNNDLKQIKKKNDDLRENDKVLRKLVENIANDREQVEKRIFFLQNQAIKSKSSQQKLRSDLQTLKQKQNKARVQNQNMIGQLKQLRDKIEETQQQRVQRQQRWEQVLNLIKQIPFSQ